jgi:hypothetical protein
VGAGGEGLGEAHVPAPTPMPVPKAYCSPKLAGNQLRAKDGRAE